MGERSVKNCLVLRLLWHGATTADFAYGVETFFLGDEQILQIHKRQVNGHSPSNPINQQQRLNKTHSLIGGLARS